jgi:transposase-like protein
MNTCPHCHQTEHQIKIGLTKSGSQRYRCRACGYRYTPEPKPQGYPDALRQQAIRLYVDGLNFRRIARHLEVHHQTIINWVNAYEAQLPPSPPQPDEVSVVEQDELFTFLGAKKTSSTS